MQYFSENYNDGRAKFIALCEKFGLKVDTHIHPDVQGPKGQDLAMDCVWIGSKQAPKVLLISCGTHGLEAGAGSATILQWLDNGALQTLPKDTAIMIIHAVNPYGWAYASRTNEDNIDLNRNYLDHDYDYPPNPGYIEMHEHIIPEKIDNEGLEMALNYFHDYAKENGELAALQALTAGQSHISHGLGYGGTALSWSCKTIQGLVEQYLAQAQKVVTIDWHTGVGPYAQPYFIIEDDVGSAMHKRAGHWWGAGYIHADDMFEDSAKPNYAGLVLSGLQTQISKLNGADVLSVVIEWGTYGLDSMLQALIMDTWLRTKAKDPNAVDSLILKERLIERFYPSQPEWRRSVLNHSERIYAQTLSGLKSW